MGAAILPSSRGRPAGEGDVPAEAAAGGDSGEGGRRRQGAEEGGGDGAGLSTVVAETAGRSDCDFFCSSVLSWRKPEAQQIRGNSMTISV